METNDKIIKGKIHADNLLKKIYPLSIDYIKKYGKKPTLAVVLIGNDPASEVYVRNKITTANKNNIDSLKITFSKEVSENILLDKIIELNNNPDVHGILVQLPLPKHISEKLVIRLNRINIPFRKLDCSILKIEDIHPILLLILILCVISIESEYVKSIISILS